MKATWKEINNVIALADEMRKKMNAGVIEPWAVSEELFCKEILSKIEEQETSNNFYETLAIELRKLWPQGEKDGKYPWRGSVEDIAKRLKLLWAIRELKKYTLEDCLSIARRYLSQFETNAKYMKTLKYFILRQNEKVIANDGKIHYINQSTLADMLEGMSSFEKQEEWESAFEDNSIQGELI